MESLFLTAWILFAQGDGGAAKPPASGNEMIFQILTMVIPIGIIFYFLIIRPQRREAAKRQDMISAIKKNDRVVTIGGIYGVVTNVQADKGKITIRVDDNAKLEMAQSAIARVVTDGDSDDK